MIDVVGSAKLSFMFPAPRETAYQYYQDMGRVVQHLPHIHLISILDDETFRLMYDTVELGAYRIRILCDVQAELDETRQLLRFNPVAKSPHIEMKAGFKSATARGYYASNSYFVSEGEQTRIEYELDLQAELPTPLALRVVPGGVLNRISYNITNWRIDEIAGGFIENSIAHFPQWQAVEQRPVVY